MIIIQNPVTVIEAVQTSKFNLDFIVDYPITKTVVAQIYPLDETLETPIQGTAKLLTLWSNDEYDAIGNWTQQQANDKIIELLTQ